MNISTMFLLLRNSSDCCLFVFASLPHMSIWSGDKTLKSKVKDVIAYNLEMGMLYQKCAFAFMLSGICCLISLGFGIVMLVLDCTAGVYLMYRSYKRILERNS